MPDLVLHVAEGTQIGEPVWCYLGADRTPAANPSGQRQPREQAAGLNDITGVHIVCPSIDDDALTLAMADAGVISCGAGPEHLLELELDGGRQTNRADVRPDLPLVLKW
jgi:hypothetical protein